MRETESGGLLEIYIVEISKMLDKLEILLLEAEDGGYESKAVEEIFRLMHSMKGAAATMGYDNVTKLTHAMEDVFAEIREKGTSHIDTSWITSMLLICKDFLSEELEKVSNGVESDGDSAALVEEIRKNLKYMKKATDDTRKIMATEEELEEAWKKHTASDIDGMKSYYAKIYFEKDAGMLNVRALILVQRISEAMMIREHIPYELSAEASETLIIRKGFQIIFDSNLDLESVKQFITDNAVCMDRLELSVFGEKDKTSADDSDIVERIDKKNRKESELEKNAESKDRKVGKGHLTIGVEKLDKLMDITSEIIITEALLVENPDLKGVDLQNFEKVARQFRKITNELQDVVMSLRMLPIAQVFQKMKRIVRDVSEKLGKKVELNIVGEGTEVDKNIIEMISDPLMHIIRNSIDHGIEMPEERKIKGKPETGKITLEARHVGSEVWIEITDDGAGLNREKIYKKAFEVGLTDKIEDELSDSEIYKFIFQPGFSTNEETTEYSGRGVGMDVVLKNIQTLHGSASIEKTSSKGTSIALKIPLTLAIINGMAIKVGDTKYIVPVESIVEIISLQDENILIDTEAKEIINIRNKYYALVKLYERFGITKGKRVLTEGMAIIVQTSDEDICIFADELIGEQQVVVKPLPEYLKKVKGISGCSILGDGSISLIIDTEMLLS